MLELDALLAFTGPEVVAMISVHAAAQLEHVRNAMVLAKRQGRGYASFLEEQMPGDYDNEFVAKCRRNERWHELWDGCDAQSELDHRYTTAENRIDAAAIGAQLAQLAVGVMEPG